MSRQSNGVGIAQPTIPTQLKPLLDGRAAGARLKEDFKTVTKLVAELTQEALLSFEVSIVWCVLHIYGLCVARVGFLSCTYVSLVGYWKARADCRRGPHCDPDNG